METEGTMVLVLIIAYALHMIFLYLLIRNAVNRHLVELQKQNQILIKMLNEQGVDKDDLQSMYNQKKGFWSTLKSFPANKQAPVT